MFSFDAGPWHRFPPCPNSEQPGFSFGRLGKKPVVGQFMIMEDPEKEMERLLSSGGVRFEGFASQGKLLSPAEIIDVLGPRLEEKRRSRIDAVLEGRSYHIVPVVEGLVNTGNVSAVMRTAEGLGLQAFHIIKGKTAFKHSVRTTQGAQKWLDVSVWEEPTTCCAALREQGYRIVATHLDAHAVPIEQIDFSQPTALVFGNELNGISPEMSELADQTCILPQPGFAQSYNISVAAAMSLYEARRQYPGGDLTDEDRIRLRADFYMRSTRHADDFLLRHLGLK